MVKNNQINNRETWNSRIGYILSTLGMAVGIGAVWRFPMVTAQYGGGAFVLAFVILTIVIVIPAGLAESSLGRRYGKGAVSTLTEVAGKKGKVFGYLMTVTPIGLLSYYPIIMATVLMYIFHTVIGTSFLSDVTGFYNHLNCNKFAIFILVFAINGVTALISIGGIKNGVEKACKIMLPTMLILILLVCVRVLSLDGISEGVKFYLEPDFSQLKSVELWMSAAGMALFAVGLGPGFLLTYGSYLDKESDLATDFLTVIISQLLICLLCGFAIIPAVVLFGIDPLSGGTGLLFQSLPLVFSEFSGGMIWFGLFMIALFFSGLASTIAQMEIPVASIMDDLNISRKKAILIVVILTTLLSIPAVWSDVFFVFLDNLVGNALYCITAAGVAAYLAWVVSARKIREEWYNPTSVVKYGRWMDVLYKYVAVPTFLYFAITSVISLF